MPIFHSSLGGVLKQTVEKQKPTQKKHSDTKASTEALVDAHAIEEGMLGGTTMTTPRPGTMLGFALRVEGLGGRDMKCRVYISLVPPKGRPNIYTHQ